MWCLTLRYQCGYVMLDAVWDGKTSLISLSREKKNYIFTIGERKTFVVVFLSS